MFKKLHLKMIFTFTLLIVISLSTLSFTNYSQVSKQMNHEVRQNATEQANELKNLIDLYLNQYSLSIEQFSKDSSLLQFVNPTNSEEERKLSWNNLKSNFANFLDVYPEIQTIYIGDEKKNMDLVPHIDLTGFDPTSRPWYIAASQSPDQVIWTEPYIDEATNEYVITAAKAIKHGSKITGVIGIDISLDELETMVSEINVNHNGYAFLLDQSGKALVHPTMRGEDLSDLPFIQKMYQSDDHGGVDYEFENNKRVLVFDTLNTTDWKVGTVYLDQELRSAANQLRNINLIISSIIIAISIFITYLISTNISRPISKLTKEVEKVANGDFTVIITSKSKDEVGRLSDSLNSMVLNTKKTNRSR
ncbi:MAG: Cache 3/Cache 2 fusion domain-containing protein [Bacillaceae bacterium]|nr:Cache 3/Cache 2 fusion domain-containing protein [Bacillaceae bacterium]